MTLRLVRDEPPKPKRRRSERASSPLSATQQAKVKAALRSLRVAYGGWGPLSEALGLPPDSAVHLVSPRRVITGDVLLRTCKAGGLSVDAMLSETLADTGRCRSCGARRIAS